MISDPCTEQQKLLQRIAMLEDQNAGMFEANHNLHMENERLQKLIREHIKTMKPLIASLEWKPYDGL